MWRPGPAGVLFVGSGQVTLLAGDAGAVRLALTVRRQGRYPLVASMARLHARGARLSGAGYAAADAADSRTGRLPPDADPSIRPHHTKAHDCAHIQPEGR